MSGDRDAPAARPAEVLLAVGGGIAAFKVAALASRLVQDGWGVQVAMSRSAPEFVGPLTFAGLTGREPILRATQVDGRGRPAHVAATRDARLMVVAPATADLLARFAAGLCDDAVGLAAVTVRCPILLCPAMNDAMWESPAVAQNLETLRARGWDVLGPVEGHLAEGYAAIGRMVEPEEIAAEVRRRLRP